MVYLKLQGKLQMATLPSEKSKNFTTLSWLQIPTITVQGKFNLQLFHEHVLDVKW